MAIVILVLRPGKENLHDDLKQVSISIDLKIKIDLKISFKNVCVNVLILSYQVFHLSPSGLSSAHLGELPKT